METNMPKGDPAGYLPSVKKARKAKGKKAPPAGKKSPMTEAVQMAAKGSKKSY
jgi:hypothetical protein